MADCSRSAAPPTANLKEWLTVVDPSATFTLQTAASESCQSWDAQTLCFDSRVQVYVQAMPPIQHRPGPAGHRLPSERSFAITRAGKSGVSSPHRRLTFKKRTF